MADELTDIVNKEEHRQDSNGVLKKAGKFLWSAGLASAVTALTISTVGAIPTLVAAGFAGGGLLGSMMKGEKPLIDNITDALFTYATVGSIVYPMTLLGEATFPLVGGLGESVAGPLGGMISKSGYALTAYLGTFIGAFNGINHLFRNYLNPKGITKAIKTNYWNDYKRFAWSFSPALVSGALGIPTWFGAPAFALNAFPAAAYHSYRPPGEKKEKKYTAPAPTPTPAPTGTPAPQLSPG